MPNTLTKTLALLSTVICMAAANAGPAVVESRFEVDAEDWTMHNLLSPGGGGEAPQYVPAGQRIASPDLHPWNVFSAPAKFLGDMAGYAGGTLTFELSDTERDQNADEIWPTLILRSGGTYLGWFGGAPETALTPYTATLSASNTWRKLTGLNATGPVFGPTSESDFVAVLGALDALYINADWKTTGGAGGPNDFAELDNVRLSAAVPEPNRMLLLLAGLGVLGVAARRRAS
ncbi:MAG: PEP-CTERM sorting domain-containing protein [Burkholderiaceae bacterium]|nr:PEP-CTERM sorting domain-containing protein [Burkholderiaceae bacterium]